MCRSSLAEYDGPCSHAEEKLRDRVFGREGTGRQLNINDVAYPKCNSCNTKPNVIKRKRSKVVAEDLAGRKKKMQGKK